MLLFATIYSVHVLMNNGFDLNDNQVYRSLHCPVPGTDFTDSIRWHQDGGRSIHVIVLLQESGYVFVVKFNLQI